ncbi:SDR family NAD(P)-dependent oxidoreductase [Pseudaquidulcibacter saccharophilus]|uniref:SDR family NAD(P)-dependent oxidoreductase n=1 Tax=Pseudaquidulcibacter saccharophilus TaxID=2831900 RepID=UPI001EFF1E6D|nr:SDR family NAD(P)-dependent oxidoreductase [Pseudaquidulcibacter saccharophilus]
MEQSIKQENNWAKGKIAFITGATSGFGAALTRRIIAAGGKVIATGRREERLDELVEELGSGQLLTRTLDLTDTDKIEECIKTLPSDFADIDILFNNAGLALGLGGADAANLSDWDTMIDTNVRALVHVTRHVLEIMVKNNRGDIINMGSVAGTYPYVGGNVYGATKAFVHQFSLNLRADLLGKNIRVTNIEPGMCETEFSLVRFKGDKSAADNVYKGMKPLSADDIALTVESVLKLPAHININTLEIMPVQQAFAGFAVNRD